MIAEFVQWRGGEMWVWLTALGVAVNALALFLWLKKKAKEDEERHERTSNRLEALLRGMVTHWHEERLEAQERDKKLKAESPRVQHHVTNHLRAHTGAIEWLDEEPT